MHLRGITKTKITPSNIYFCENNKVKLDMFSYTTSFQLNTDNCFGYESPESLLTDDYDSYAADMWSVGVILAELITSKESLIQGRAHLSYLDSVF